MCQRKQLTVVVLSILIAGCHGASTSFQNHAATAEGSTPQAVGPSAASGGVGSGEALRVSFTEAAASADARTRAPTNPNRVEFDRGRLPELPSVPTSGTRKQASTRGFATPQPSRIRLCDIAGFPCPFDGVAQDNCASCTNPPPDPNAAVGAGKIVEVVNDLIQVTNRLGAVQCGGPVTLNRLLRTADSLTDPRVQFDNVNQRFSFSVTVSNPGPKDTPAMFVAATETDDPWGNTFFSEIDVVRKTKTATYR